VTTVETVAVRGVHEAPAIGLAQHLDGPLVRQLPAHVTVVAEAQTDVERLGAVAPHGTAVAGPEIDVRLGAQQRLGLIEQ